MYRFLDKKEKLFFTQHVPPLQSPSPAFIIISDIPPFSLPVVTNVCRVMYADQMQQIRPVTTMVHLHILFFGMVVVLKRYNFNDFVLNQY